MQVSHQARRSRWASSLCGWWHGTSHTQGLCRSPATLLMATSPQLHGRGLGRSPFWHSPGTWEGLYLWSANGSLLHTPRPEPACSPHFERSPGPLLWVELKDPSPLTFIGVASSQVLLGLCSLRDRVHACSGQHRMRRICAFPSLAILGAVLLLGGPRRPTLEHTDCRLHSCSAVSPIFAHGNSIPPVVQARNFGVILSFSV